MNAQTFATWLLAAAGAAAFPSALAQPAPGPSGARQPPVRAEAEEAREVREAVGARVARLAMVYLRLVADPRTTDFELATMLLERALDLIPGDEEILRRLIESRHASGDEEGVFKGTEALLRVAPDDTVAQLRLISMRVGRLQDAPARMALYDRMLGPAGTALHPTVRSRLALDDALLARETGDEDRFVRRLAQALQLDSTNKEAALLAASFSIDATADPLARVELRANIVLADPIDLGAHMSLARELLSHGAFAGASRFYNRTADLYAQNAEPGDDPLLVEGFCAFWGANGGEQELEKLRKEEEIALYYWRKEAEALHKAGEDPNLASAPKVNAAMETVRAYCAASIGLDADAQSAVERFSRQTDASLQAVAQAITEGQVQDEDAKFAISVARSERLWLRLLAGVEIEEAPQDLEAIRTTLDPAALQRFEGLLAMRTGRLAEAVRLLAPLAETDPRARAGLALAAELSGDRARAASEYARIILNTPGALPYPAPPLGLWARGRLERLLEEPVRPSDTQRALDDYALRLPTAIEDMTRSPSSFMHLQMSLVKDALSPLERSIIRVKLANIGVIPLAVGPSSPLNSVLLLSPTLTTQVTSRMSDVEPEVASLDRRLALAPGEWIVADIWADQAKVGDILDLMCAGASSLRWTGIQGFKLLSGGEYEQGAMCLIAETGVQSRRPAADPGLPFPRIIEKLKTARGAELLEWILLARNMSLTASDPPATDEERALAASPDAVAPFWKRDPIATTLAERLPGMSELEAAFTILQLPAARTLTRPLLEMQPLDDAARADVRPLVRMATLLTRAPSSEDDLYDQVIAGDDPELSRFARLLKIRRLIDARDRVRLEQAPSPDAPPTPQNNDMWNLTPPAAPASPRPQQ